MSDPVGRIGYRGARTRSRRRTVVVERRLSNGALSRTRSADTLRDWLATALPAEEAVVWWGAGAVPLPEALAWREAGYDPADAELLEVLLLYGPLTGDPPGDSVAEWRTSGLPARWACLCVAAGISGCTEARSAWEAALRHPEIAARLTDQALARGVDPWRHSLLPPRTVRVPRTRLCPGTVTRLATAGYWLLDRMWTLTWGRAPQPRPRQHRTGSARAGPASPTHRPRAEPG